MIDREKHIAQKRKDIEKIARQQMKLIKKAAKIPLAKSRRMDVNLRRLGKVFVITMQIRTLEMQKQMIIARPIHKPIPSFVPGGMVPAGFAFVGEGGKEIIITKTGNIEIK